MVLIKLAEGEVGVGKAKAGPKCPWYVCHGCPIGGKIRERMRRKGSYTSDWGGDHTSLRIGNSMTGN